MCAVVTVTATVLLAGCATTLRRRWNVVGAAIGVLLTSCSTTAITPSATVTTLSPDAERLFSLSWESIPERDGTHVRLRGYLGNLYGETAARVQLLAQALDANGNVVDQKIEWVPGTVSSFGRVYYEIPNMRPANQYRVTVWAFDRGRGPSSADGSRRWVETWGTVPGDEVLLRAR